MNAEKTKQCLSCYSEIDARALVCPHCGRAQSFGGKWKSTIFWCLLLCVLAGSLAYEIFIYEDFAQSASFQDHIQDIQITQSNMSVGNAECSNAKALIIMGDIKNSGEIDWENLTFEVIFYDHDKNQIDTMQEQLYGFVLPSMQEIPFKLSVGMSFDESLYASHSLRVIAAEEKFLY